MHNKTGRFSHRILSIFIKTEISDNSVFPVVIPGLSQWPKRTKVVIYLLLYEISNILKKPTRLNRRTPSFGTSTQILYTTAFLVDIPELFRSIKSRSSFQSLIEL